MDVMFPVEEVPAIVTTIGKCIRETIEVQDVSLAPSKSFNDRSTSTGDGNWTAHLNMMIWEDAKSWKRLMSACF